MRGVFPWSGGDRAEASGRALGHWERFYCAISRSVRADHGSGSDVKRGRGTRAARRSMNSSGSMTMGSAVFVSLEPFIGSRSILIAERIVHVAQEAGSA